ncbi:MAG: TonB family protein [Bacteroidetes bacterium]|nr:TonB family protein [Bacteroidota bacterium]
MLMKGQFLIFSTLLFALTATCQETKLVTKKIGGQISEKYYVLKSDGTTKHGEYISFYTVTDEEYKEVKKGTLSENFITKEKGYYKFGKKDSLWTEYLAPQRSSKNGGRQTAYGGTKSEGHYKNDKKVGVWLTYKNEVTERFDYDNNKKLQPYIHVNAVYPQSAKESGLQGTVTVSYQTHKDCSVTEINVTKSLSPDCDKAAIDAIKKMSDLLKKYGIDCEEKIETQDINFKLL